MPDRRQTLGRLGEGYAADHLARLGFRVLARNHRTRHGEIDLVAAGDGLLVFCEVKSRRVGTGSPLDAFTRAKQAQVRAMATVFLATVEDRPRAVGIRFDAIGVVIDAAGRLVRLDHLEGAF